MCGRSSLFEPHLTPQHSNSPLIMLSKIDFLVSISPDSYSFSHTPCNAMALFVRVYHSATTQSPQRPHSALGTVHRLATAHTTAKAVPTIRLFLPMIRSEIGGWAGRAGLGRGGEVRVRNEGGTVDSCGTDLGCRGRW